MKLSDGETPLVRKPTYSKGPTRPEMVALVVQLLELNHKLKLMKPISPRIQ